MAPDRALCVFFIANRFFSPVRARASYYSDHLELKCENLENRGQIP